MFGLFGKKKEADKKTSTFVDWLKAVHEMSVSGEFSREEKRAKLREYIDVLPEDVYAKYFPQIVGIIQKSRENCMPYKNTNEQVANIVTWLPRLESNKELLVLYIRERRKKYGLEV